MEVTPAGKSMKKLSLLSGGEKSLVALAFMFAVFLARPCPFYILDEVEAALDDLNIDRFLQLVHQYSDRAQFIIVTHQKRTMDAADVLYGVSMGGDGISKVVSRKLPTREQPLEAVAERGRSGRLAHRRPLRFAACHGPTDRRLRLRRRHPHRPHRRRGRLADDAAAPDHRRLQPGRRDRHRPRLRRDHEDGRRLAPPERRATSTCGCRGSSPPGRSPARSSV